MTKPKLKEHLFQEMVNELREFAWVSYEFGLDAARLDQRLDYGRARTHINKIVSKYIEAGE